MWRRSTHRNAQFARCARYRPRVCALTYLAWQSVPGVEESEVDLDNKTATVKFDSGTSDAQALIKATAQAGDPVKVR